MFASLRMTAACALVVAGGVFAAEPASAGIGYYYSAPSYYYAPPVYGPSFGYGPGPGYYGGYGYGPGYYGGPAFGVRSYGYPSYGYYSPYRYYGYRPYRLGIGRSVFDLDD